jgi:diketogulonate reductase-like aldo/keto reductase
MEELVEHGKIGAWGVSNFDVDDMEELWRIPDGQHCQVNQVLYHPASRGIEFNLLPWMRSHDVALMAYRPLAQAGSLRRGLFSSPELTAVAQRHEATVPQVILAWDVRDGHTVAIPKSCTPEHARENAAAANIQLDTEDLALIDKAWPAPSRKVPLDIQ